MILNIENLNLRLTKQNIKTTVNYRMFGVDKLLIIAYKYENLNASFGVGRVPSTLGHALLL